MSIENIDYITPDYVYFVIDDSSMNTKNKLIERLIDLCQDAAILNKVAFADISRLSRSSSVYKGAIYELITTLHNKGISNLQVNSIAYETNNPHTDFKVVPNDYFKNFSELFLEQVNDNILGELEFLKKLILLNQIILKFAVY